MGMDMNSGQIRELVSVKELREGEALFEVNEKLKIKGYSFKIKEIFEGPLNEIVLQGISKIEELFEKADALKENLK